MATFEQLVLQPEVGIRFLLQVQGLPDVFVDGPIPVGPDGTPWTAPDSKGRPGTWRPGMLDRGQSIQVQGPDIRRRDATSSPGGLALRLLDDRAGTLRTLFASEGAREAYLASPVGYDDGAGCWVSVDSAAGWPASGFLHLGRECLYYPSITDDSFDCRVASGGRRDLFSVGYCDSAYTADESSPLTPGVVTDRPTCWHGRHVQLWAILVDVSGAAFDTALGGPCCREVWRGIIQGDPRLSDSWSSWQLDTRSIDCLLHSDVGSDALKGTLVRVPGTAEDNTSGTASLTSWDVESSTDEWGPFGPTGKKLVKWTKVKSHFAFVFTDENRFAVLTVTEYANATDYQAGTVASRKDYFLPLFASGSIASSHLVSGLWDLAMREVGGPSYDYPDLTVDLRAIGAGWQASAHAAAGKVFVLDLQWTAPGSIGALLGYQAPERLLAAPYGGGVVTTESIAVDIRPTSGQIPVFFSPGQNGATNAPPSSGSCRIGDGDDAEIITYSSVTASFAVEGLYVLSGCVRGRFGTVPRAYQVRLDATGKPDQEEVGVTFGAAFDGTSVTDLILRLATSTGSGLHGSADVLGQRMGVPIPPAHFDLARFDAVADGLLPFERDLYLFISKPRKLAELAADILAPLGLYLTARPTPGGCRITLDEVRPALLSEAVVAVGAGELDGEDPANYQPGNDTIVNEVQLSYSWDAAREETRDGATVTVTDDNSIARTGERHRLEWALIGRPWSAAEAQARGTAWAAGIFQRYGSPYSILKLRTGRAGWLLAPGDTVALTVPGLPGPDGAASTVDRLAVVVASAHDYWTQDGAPGSTVVVALERPVRQSTYSPSGRVDSYDAEGPSVTLVEHAYSSAGDPVDATHFDVGDVLRILHPGDLASVAIRTVTARLGSVLTLDAPLTWDWDALTVVVATRWDDATPTQQRHTFIADGAPPTLGALDDAAFRYV